MLLIQALTRNYCLSQWGLLMTAIRNLQLIWWSISHFFSVTILADSAHQTKTTATSAGMMIQTIILWHSNWFQLAKAVVTMVSQPMEILTWSVSNVTNLVQIVQTMDRLEMLSFASAVPRDMTIKIQQLVNVSSSVLQDTMQLLINAACHAQVTV